MFAKLLDWLLPPRCVVSGDVVDSHGMVSANVWKSLNFITTPYCCCCGLPFEVEISSSGVSSATEALLCGQCSGKKPPYGWARSALRYDDGSRPLILGFKHGDKTFMAPTFAGWLMQCLDNTNVGAIDCCVPVPLHRWRLLKRRYNQAGLLASLLGQEIGCDTIVDGLLRVKHTGSMDGKSRTQRQDNVRKAFVVNEKRLEQIAGKTVLLVDDVFTTGATVESCTRTLLKAGAKEVNVLCLARVVSGYD